MVFVVGTEHPLWSCSRGDCAGSVAERIGYPMAGCCFFFLTSRLSSAFRRFVLAIVFAMGLDKPAIDMVFFSLLLGTVRNGMAFS